MLMVEQVYNENFVKLILPYNLGIVTIASLDKIKKNNIKVERYVRSYDSAGRVLLWEPPKINFKKSAADIEHFDRNVEFISKSLGFNPEYFLANWVCNETLAKLLDIPILKLIKEKKFVEFIKSDLKFYLCKNENFQIYYFKLDKYRAFISIGFLF